MIPVVIKTNITWWTFLLEHLLTLLKDRIIMLTGPVEDNMANSIIAQLVCLDARRQYKRYLSFMLIHQVDQFQLVLVIVDNELNQNLIFKPSLWGWQHLWRTVSLQAVPKVNVSCCKCRVHDSPTNGSTGEWYSTDEYGYRSWTLCSRLVVTWSKSWLRWILVSQLKRSSCRCWTW